MATKKRTSIPKPPKAEQLEPNLDEQHLIQWKKLFEDLDPNIKVYTILEHHFNATRKEYISDHQLDRLDLLARDVKMIVDLSYIVVCTNRLDATGDYFFLKHDDAFNDQSIYDLDFDNAQAHVSEKWEVVYREIAKLIKDARNQVPPPPEIPT